MSVTQKELAEKLNVSQSQVARALKGVGRVSEETRLRVEQMARELGYDMTSNSAARVLAGKRHGQTPKNGIIAVMYEAFRTDPPSLGPRAIPFFETILDGFEDEAFELGLDVCMCRARERELPRLVREHKVDAVITLGYRQTHIQRIGELGLPVILFHDRSEQTHNILPDDYDGARQATEHFLGLGHRRIAFINVWNHRRWPVVRRQQGYLDTMHEHGITVPDSWVIEDLWAPDTTANLYCSGCGTCSACSGWATLMARNGFDASKGTDSGNKELPFTAVVCYNDAVAMGVITQAQAAGIKVPEDLSVVGFDDISGAYNFTPRITSIDFSRYQLGRETMRLLNQILQEAEEHKGDEASIELHSPVFPVHLNIHESTRELVNTSIPSAKGVKAGTS
jgi:DNA-binding LacI/PurR family transcriptional regulator